MDSWMLGWMVFSKIVDLNWPRTRRRAFDELGCLEAGSLSCCLFVWML